MTEPTTRNFLGIPITGDITMGSRKSQRPLEEFQPLVQALLNDPGILEFGWQQYTPYFNDGDTCEFSAEELWVRTNADTAEDIDPYDLVLTEHRSMGKYLRTYDEELRKYVSGEFTGPDETRFLIATALRKALEGGMFDNVLFEAFGDHAQVTVCRDGITVDTYHHD